VLQNVAVATVEQRCNLAMIASMHALPTLTHLSLIRVISMTS